MSTVEHIEKILNSGRLMSTYRIDINPDTYRHRVVVGCKIVIVVSDEYDTMEEAEKAMQRLNDRSMET